MFLKIFKYLRYYQINIMDSAAVVFEMYYFYMWWGPDLFENVKHLLYCTVSHVNYGSYLFEVRISNCHDNQTTLNLAVTHSLLSHQHEIDINQTIKCSINFAVFLISSSYVHILWIRKSKLRSFFVICILSCCISRELFKTTLTKMRWVL